MNDWLRWHLAPSTGPKRILALDGGGVRGLVTLGILQRIEDTLRSRYPHPDDFRLCYYFDLIAGTSTGSIIATALALGFKVSQIVEIYQRICPKLFYPVARGFWRPIFDHRPLESELKSFLGDEQLQSDKLRTGLMVCAKRIDTGSPWVLTNNPSARYWSSKNNKFRPNREYELRMIVRASTAAPLYFEPVEVVINEGGIYPRDVGLFVDGAVAGLNNPSFQAFLTATLPAYGFGWPSGRNNLLLTSIGTGWWRQQHHHADFLRLANWKKATESLAAMIQDTSLHAILALQSMSEPRKPWPLNTEIGTIAGQLACGVEALTFQRYDALITAETVKRVFEMRGETASQVARINELTATLRELGNTDHDIMHKLFTIGYDVGHVTEPGSDGIEPEDFPVSFDPPWPS